MIDYFIYLPIFIILRTVAEGTCISSSCRKEEEDNVCIDGTLHTSLHNPLLKYLADKDDDNDDEEEEVVDDNDDNFAELS
jgi:hypothetical protein